MKAYAYFKRALDIAAAALLLPAALLLMLLCALAVRLDDRRAPVMYNTLRIGRGLKPFKMYKLRTIDPQYEGGDRLTAHMMTRPGRLMRRTGLDELPQLFNILRGDMSFVGPRPLLPSYVPWYTRRQNIRHTVRPGLTGLAQIRGGADLRWDRRFELDAEYVESMSFEGDLAIAAGTVSHLLGRRHPSPREDGNCGPFDRFQREQIKNNRVSAGELLSAHPYGGEG